MQDDERKIPIHSGVKRSMIKVKTELCQHFGSDTITRVVFIIQLSYIDAGWREKKIPIHFGVKTELYQHFGSDTITWLVFNVYLSYFIHRCRMIRGRYLYILASKVKVATELCQHFGSDKITCVVSTYSFHISYIEAGWRKEDTYTRWGQKVKVTTERCQHFGSDTITLVVFKVQLSYFIHRCRMVRGRYLYIWCQKVTGQGHNVTLSTLWDYSLCPRPF